MRRFESGARAAARENKLNPTAETLRLLAEGHSLDEIAKIRGRQRSTIVSMISDLVERGEVEFQPGWVDRAKQEMIEKPAIESAWRSSARLKKLFPQNSHTKRSD